MAEILKALGELAERGPIVVSLIAICSILVILKWMIPIIRDSSVSNTKLAASIDRLSGTNGAMATALTVVEKKVDDVHDSVIEIVDRLEEHDGRITHLEIDQAEKNK